MKKRARAKKEPLTRLRNRCDALWREAIFAIHGAKCLVCLERPATQAHHIFNKSANNAFRYDIRNGLPVCTKCHLRERYNSTPAVIRAYESYRDKFWGLWLEVKEGPTARTWTRAELEEVEKNLRGVLGL
jgi:5-methylcytosine-specific restriction endonuclease McrA